MSIDSVRTSRLDQEGLQRNAAVRCAQRQIANRDSVRITCNCLNSIRRGNEEAGVPEMEAECDLVNVGKFEFNSKGRALADTAASLTVIGAARSRCWVG